MQRTKSSVLVLCLCALVMGLFLGGCSSEETKMTKQEEQQFKGGPMPPEAAAGMAKRMQDAQKK